MNTKSGFDLEKILSLEEIAAFCQTNIEPEVLSLYRDAALQFFSDYTGYVLLETKRITRYYKRVNMYKFLSFGESIIELDPPATDREVLVYIKGMKNGYRFRTTSDGRRFLFRANGSYKLQSDFCGAISEYIELVYRTGQDKTCEYLENDIKMGVMLFIKESLKKHESSDYKGDVLENSGAVKYWANYRVN